MLCHPTKNIKKTKSVANKHKKNYICIVKNYISKIFTVYFILLALIPCSDIFIIRVCLPVDKIHIEQSAQQENHCNSLCSPLCVCLCCNDVTTVSNDFIFEHFNNNTKYIQTEYLHSSYHYLESSSPPPKS